jgi:hypothetical protein
VEYGHFKRRDKDFRDRSSGENRGSGDNRDRGFNRDRGGDFRGTGGGFNRERTTGGGGFRERSGDFRDRGDRSDREPEESVFSKRVRAGKRRTYFFDVRKTKGSDFFITITESTRREDGFGYKRHKIFLYKEDFNRFVASLNEVVDHVKTDLMPDFDYEEFDRRQAEWEAQNKEFEGEGEDEDHHDPHDENPDKEEEPEVKKKKDDDEPDW